MSAPIPAPNAQNIIGDDQLRDLAEDKLEQLAAMAPDQRHIGLIWDRDEVQVGIDPAVTRMEPYVAGVEPDPLLIRIPFCELSGIPSLESGGDVLHIEAVCEGRRLRWRIREWHIAEWCIDLAAYCIVAICDFDEDITR